MDEPWTNRMVPAVCFGSPAHFSNRNSFAPSLVVQCSSPLIAAAGFVISFMLCTYICFPDAVQHEVVHR